jgi:5-methylcytosine-specific restriction endonuclease McrA
VKKNFEEYPEQDKDWEDNHWKDLLEHLIEEKLVTYKEITSLVLGHLNPSQVGTSIASNKNFQANFYNKGGAKRKFWQEVKKWSFDQAGVCQDCGTRLELQADHINPRQTLGLEADYLENLTYRCRRCNVVRRPSHKKGGLTFLTSESALMWILFTRKPKTYDKFKRLCRTYGLSMADIRFQEAWAMAMWLKKTGNYEIDED